MKTWRRQNQKKKRRDQYDVAVSVVRQKNVAMGPSGARNQEWLCWRRPAAICPTDDRLSDRVSYESGDGTRSWLLAVSAELVESTLLNASTKRLVKT
jgi:hypothetical protein